MEEGRGEERMGEERGKEEKGRLGVEIHGVVGKGRKEGCVGR